MRGVGFVGSGLADQAASHWGVWEQHLGTQPQQASSLLMMNVEPAISLNLSSPVASHDLAQTACYPAPLVSHMEVRADKMQFDTCLSKFLNAMGTSLGRCAFGPKGFCLVKMVLMSRKDVHVPGCTRAADFVGSEPASRAR